jgi:hypothetical protein
MQRARLKKWKPRLLVAAALCALAGSDARSSEKMAKPMDHLEVSQAWIGISQDELLFLRLDLNQNGTGVGCYLSLDDEGHPFTIQSWTYKVPDIEFNSAGTLYFGKLSGRIVGRAMELTMSGPRWQSRIFLRRESDLVPKWQKLRNAMSSMKTQAPLSP